MSDWSKDSLRAESSLPTDRWVVPYNTVTWGMEREALLIFSGKSRLTCQSMKNHGTRFLKGLEDTMASGWLPEEE
jgi:hypothetical protein